MSTGPKMLAQVRDVTGKIIHLGMFEEVYGLSMTETQIVLGIDRVKYEDTYVGQVITKRGKQIYTWHLTEFGTWQLIDTQAVWWSTDEVHVSRERRKPDSEWAEMCHRPGTSRTPLDNAARTSQGY